MQDFHHTFPAEVIEEWLVIRGYTDNPSGPESAFVMVALVEPAYIHVAFKSQYGVDWYPTSFAWGDPLVPQCIEEMVRESGPVVAT